MQRINFQGITFISDATLSTVSIKELEAIEARLGFTFPGDYRAFISTLGFGETEFHVQAFPPLDQNLFEPRDRLAEFWFWGRSSQILTQTHAVECVGFFGSADGDTILFHPLDRNRWYILPHEEEEAILVQSFQELSAYFLQRYDDLQAPYEFEPWSDINIHAATQDS
ncbi:SMI1/KNR4 family protein [Leptolyngbya sp. DQ-M1]|uniref:SMI1/KNR4 family protein n=1 Tax=Leptolyngbya sp. DQ-M1 TaxID=2933920 RepID=UPI0032982EAE